MSLLSLPFISSAHIAVLMRRSHAAIIVSAVLSALIWGGIFGIVGVVYRVFFGDGVLAWSSFVHWYAWAFLLFGFLLGLNAFLTIRSHRDPTF